MKIDCYTIAYNEEKMVGFFINHYSRFCRNINVMDNYSTDRTAEIVESYNSDSIRVKKYDSGGKLNDSIYLEIKNNCWKDSDADYVIIVDCDELLYHPDIIGFLETTRQQAYRPHGFDMITDTFPYGEKYITESVKEGIYSPNYSKVCIFSPSQMQDINYTLGCHRASPVNKRNELVHPYQDEALKLLHYKNISFQYRYAKHLEYRDRMSEFNENVGAGIHYTYDQDKQRQEFNDIFNSRKRVI